MRIIPRSEWGARYDNGAGPAPLPAAEVWLHHSVTPAVNGTGIIRELEQIGESRFGTGISYTWPITPDGAVYEGHSVNRQGTHTGGRNDSARAICFVGNYETDVPTDAQIRSAAWLLQHAKANGWIRNAQLTGGHRDLKATACPGRHAYVAIPTINQLAAGGPIQEDNMGVADDEIQWYIDRAKNLGFGKKLGDVFIDTYIWASKVPALMATVGQIAAAVADGDLDPDILAARLDTAVRQATTQAVVDTILPEIQRIRDALEQDDISEARAYVDELAERLRPAA